MNNPGSISVVSAGAGTGKTWRLSTEYLDAARAGISTARIIATTFTIKAAAELKERVRERLIREGCIEAAQNVLAGLVGTVNSVCGRLVSDFAIDGGLSPVADVIPPEMSDSLFRLATEEAIQKFFQCIDPVAERLQQADWPSTVLNIVRLAHGSGMEAGQFADFAAKSWEGFEPLLMPVENNKTAEDLDRALFAAIQKCISEITGGGDGTITTQNTLDALRKTASQMSGGKPLPWDDWARVSGLGAAVASRPFLQPVKKIAACHASHPRLHSDIRNFIKLVFDCAADALGFFSEFKRERGLLDFTDQEALALDLLRQPEVRARMSERFDLLMVDEFQDTSPIQLAVFLEIAKAVKRSLWVGDQKQAIFGFRQTDPALVNAVIEKIRPITGGTEETLDTSRRSRPDLVHFSNAVFSAAFPPKGVPADKVVIPNIHRTEPAGFGNSLNHWILDGDNWQIATGALAGRIRTMLTAAIPVVNRADGTARPILPGDIAILCRTNGRCRAVADALASAGIPAAMARSGLLDTPEAVLTIAALRYLVDPADSLAVAELVHYNEVGGNWLDVWLSEGADELKDRSETITALDAQRTGLVHLTPAEAIETAIAAARIDQLVRRWNRAGERLANLDALRNIAILYQDACRAGRSAATAAGLVAHLSNGLENGGEQPAFEGNDAVRVLTYHRAKGLEWPVVILLDLQDGAKASPFGAYSESPVEGLDPWKPLAGRWIRFWPWPYGKLRAGVHLDTSVMASPQYQTRKDAELAELVRLFYVGVTRARDYLVFASRAGSVSKWLDILTNADHVPVLNLPAPDGKAKAEIIVNGQAFTMAVESVGEAAAADNDEKPPTVSWYAPIPLTGEPPVFPVSRLSPSDLTQKSENSGTVKMGIPIEIGSRLPLTGKPDMRLLGEAVHGFLAADRSTRATAERKAMAENLLERWGVSGALAPASLLMAGEQLDLYIAGRWPGSKQHREVPVYYRMGDQCVSGRIDLLIETDEGCIIIDHKTFPGTHDKWIDKARGFAPQMSLYSRMVAQATKKPVIQCFIHMPVVGALIEISPSNDFA